MNSKSFVGIVSWSLVSATFVTGCQSGGGAVTGGAPAMKDSSIVLVDPKGDDNGPGTYVYPTDQAYSAGAFDVTKFEVLPKGKQVEFRLTLAGRIDDPWGSTDWGGNGFSIQMAFIHLDTTPGEGVTVGMPGTNVRFKADEAWDRVVIISPQGTTRLNAEVESKAAEVSARVVVPKVTRAVGRTLIAVVDAESLGGLPQATWGYQVLMQSNEGYPAKGDLLTRKVNEYEGQHRFGGGSDYDNDPHVLDIFAGQAQGKPEEVEAQHSVLSAFNKEATEPKPEDLAEVPLVYPQR